MRGCRTGPPERRRSAHHENGSSAHHEAIDIHAIVLAGDDKAVVAIAELPAFAASLGLPVALVVTGSSPLPSSCRSPALPVTHSTSTLPGRTCSRTPPRRGRRPRESRSR